MRRSALVWAAVLTLAVGCGEKIELPQGVGLPVFGDYRDVTPVELNDLFEGVSDLERFAGGIAVADSAAGRVVVLTGGGRRATNIEPAEGLTNPIAITVDPRRGALLTIEDNGAGFDLLPLQLRSGRLIQLERVPLGPEVQGVDDIATDTDFLYVSDPVTRTVHRFALGTDPEPFPVWSGTVTAPDPTALDVFNPLAVSRPAGLAVDEDGLLVVADADTTRNWVLRFDTRANAISDSSTGRSVIFGIGEADLEREIASFPPEQRCGNGFSLEASTLGLAPTCEDRADFRGGPDDENGTFHAPVDVAFDGAGNIYVADRENARVQRFLPDGTHDTGFGPGLVNVDDTESIQIPVRMATWDGEDVSQGGIVTFVPGARVFVLDAANGRIRVYEDQTWTTIQNTI